MSIIIPNVEVYGTYARRSALADLLEVHALRGRSASLPELADYIRDSEWTRLLGDQFNLPEESSGDLGEEVDASEYAASRVFDLLRERWDILGDLYPYRLEEGRLHYNGSPGLRHGYLLLLAVTISHAYGVSPGSLNPREFFEDVVTACFSSKGLLAANLGKARRLSSNFEEAVSEVGRICSLRPSFGNAVTRRRAQEEGVDVVAHLSWIDSRPLHWVYIIQATCGKSDTWSRKLFEPSATMWGNIFGLQVLPRSVLAVPHHIPFDVIRYLTERANGDRFIMDRLRLCILNEGTVEGAALFIEMLQALEVNFD